MFLIFWSGESSKCREQKNQKAFFQKNFSNSGPINGVYSPYTHNSWGLIILPVFVLVLGSAYTWLLKHSWHITIIVLHTFEQIIWTLIELYLDFSVKSDISKTNHGYLLNKHLLCCKLYISWKIFSSDTLSCTSFTNYFAFTRQSFLIINLKLRQD